MIFCAQCTGNLSRKKSDRNVKFFFNVHIFWFSIFTFENSSWRYHFKNWKSRDLYILLYKMKNLQSLNIPVIWLWLIKTYLQRISCIPKHIYEACIITRKYVLIFHVQITDILKGKLIQKKPEKKYTKILIGLIFLQYWWWSQNILKKLSVLSKVSLMWK